MILPLADALQNCLQNLTSRIAGIDNEQMTNRVMGMSAMLGFSAGAIKEQFKTPSKDKNTGSSSNVNNDGGGLKGFVSRAKSVINPSGISLSAERDYNGNNNPIRDNLKVSNVSNASTKNESVRNKVDQKLNNGISKIKTVAVGAAKVGYGATKTYLKVGASMAEGNFKSNNYKHNNTTKKNLQTTEYANNISKIARAIPERSNLDELSKNSERQDKE